MLTELHNKQGALCSAAKAGQLRCPLIVRPTSEDVVTGHLVQALRVLNSRWWLSDILNVALGTTRFRRQVYRKLRIEPWVNKPPFPRDLLPWDEGSTQVDFQITFENPPTTVYVEAKYASDLSFRTANGDGTQGYPTDQLIRNVRVGLRECGYYDDSNSLFEMGRRDFAVVLLTPSKGHPLIRRYSDPSRLKAAIPYSDRLSRLPRSAIVGELDYSDLISVLRKNSRWFQRGERSIIGVLVDYLTFKQQSVPLRADFGGQWRSGESATVTA